MKKSLLGLCALAFALPAFSQNGPKLRRIEGQGNDGLVLDFVQGMHDSILNSPINVYNYPLYENNRGPVYVDIYDPSLTPAGNFMIVFKDTSSNLPGNDLTDPTTKWRLVHVPTNDTVFGDSVISVDHEQDISAWGMKIRTNPTDDPGQSVYTDNGFLEATMTFSNPSLTWLTGVSDTDSTDPSNWIRSGTNGSTMATGYDDFAGFDDNEIYEGLLNGTWSPYRLAAHTEYSSAVGNPILNAAAPAWDRYRPLTMIKNLASVDIVITADKSKWTRCPVIEIQDESPLAIGGARKMDMRKSFSVDKNGRRNGDAGYNSNEGGFIDSAGVLIPCPYGMSWFPGYAVNLETGERLNMAFGEDSWHMQDNGTDMVWNPTSTVNSPSGDPVFGGKHYIYIFGHNGDLNFSSADMLLPNQKRDIPVYDNGLTLYKLFTAIENSPTTVVAETYKREIYADAMWTSIPLLNPGYYNLATDVNIRLRVSKNYRQQNIDGSNNSDPKYIFDAGTVAGLNRTVKTNEFQIYPDPATNHIRILHDQSTVNCSVEIVDIQGITIKAMNIELSEMIDVSTLNPGLYLVKISNGKKTITQRFIKQ